LANTPTVAKEKTPSLLLLLLLLRCVAGTHHTAAVAPVV
jgi:hypothetical protein